MAILLIKTKDGKVYSSQKSMHFQVCDEYGVDPNDVIDTGFVTKDRIVWQNRPPR